MTKKELRSETRLAEETTVQIQAYSSPEGKQDPSLLKRPKTVDISTRGIQIQLGMWVPVKSVMQLSMQTKHRPKPYVLIGEVRWTYQDHVDPSRHFVGFRLVENGQESDNHDWQDYVDARLKNRV